MHPNPWIESVPVYEPGRPIEEVARELGVENIEDILKVASNENELGPSPLALEAMREAAFSMHRYPDGGCFYLKEKLASTLGVHPSNLLFGSGSNELIEFLGHAYLGPGRNLVMSDMAFVIYMLVGRLFHADVIRVPMQDFTHDLEAMLAAITPETRLLIVCNPNNPTGTAVSPVSLDRLLERLPAHVLAVIDEAYIEVMPADRRPDLIRYIRDGYSNLMVLRTFSKAYGLAGLRIGYAVADPARIALLEHVRQPFNINAMAQAAACAALDDTDHLDRSYRLVEEGLAFFARELTALDIPFVPSCANFLLVKTGHGREMVHALQQRHIITRPMNGYGLPEWIRITLGTPVQNRRVMQALRDCMVRGV
ncbi:MAG TPA: histidinol-phosphate transaminase [Verrucomicrobia bacterium]|nr:histidinol-phosphate transaminase [Verrucomicrobiota bacterium]